MGSMGVGGVIGLGSIVVATFVALWLLRRRTRPGAVRWYYAVVFVPTLGALFGHRLIKMQADAGAESGLLQAADVEAAGDSALLVLGLGIGSSTLMALVGLLLFFSLVQAPAAESAVK